MLVIYVFLNVRTCALYLICKFNNFSFQARGHTLYINCFNPVWRIILFEIWQANINPAYQIPELEYCLTKVDVKALIAPESFRKQWYHEMVRTIAPEVDSCTPGQICSKRLPALTSLIMISDRELPWVTNLFNHLKTLSTYMHHCACTGMCPHTKCYKVLFMVRDCGIYISRFNILDRIKMCKIWAFHGSDYEECCLLVCDAVWLLYESTFWRNIASIIRVERINDLGTTLTASSNWNLLLTLFLAPWLFSPWWRRWYIPMKHCSYKSLTASHPRKWQSSELEMLKSLFLEI
jgi:hypothetical protein